MKSFLIRGSVLGILAGGMAACSTTPSYPTGSGQTPATPVRPAYPTQAQPRASAPSARDAQTPAAPQTSPSQSAPAEAAQVQSAALPPVSGAAPPPGPAPQSPEPYSPPPAAASGAPTQPAMRQVPARYAVAGRVVSPRGMYRQYVVQSHDHLDAIARDLQTSPDAIVDANRLKTPDHLVPGQRLKIPVEKAYVAQSGDTLDMIGRRFSVSASQLADLNDLSEHARLRTGDQIALPSDFRDHGPIEISPAHLAMATPAYRPYEATPRGGIYTPGVGVAPASPTYERGYPTTPQGGAYASNTPYRSSGATAGSLPPTPSEPAGPSLSDTQIAVLARSRFIWPVHGEIINRFGAKGLGVRNDGVDVRSPEGSVVHAAAPGDVVYAGNQIPGYGNLVLIQHADGWVTAYAHLAHISVQMRQQVAQGQEIGQVGTSGGVLEPQLHFEIRYKASAGETARPIDPLLVLPTGSSASG